ncbi:MAG: DNA-directed RNA polymerase subunit B, partial [Candidatus Diapherotrites archaeon]|nr:DNA-directed RNA polymerase subunit B [Candidatus Diapherotrites archaeon]
MREAKVYINGRLIGFHKDSSKLVKDLIQRRRQAKIDPHVGIAYHDDTNEIYINTDAGRLVRPLLVVENGKLKISDDDVRQVKEGKLAWKDLLERGILEYLDAEEEENAMVALNEEELNKDATHMEIDGASIFSVITSLIPFLEHNMVGKALHGAKMFKQALGLSAINYNLRTDTENYLLYYPQKALVKTKTSDILKLEHRPDLQNFVVAILPYYGFNVLDAVILNKGSVQRGLGRAAYFRNYDSLENRYPGGQVDKFEIPTEETVGFLGEDAYKQLGDDGLVEVEAIVSEKDVIVGRTSPPRFLEEITEFGIVKEKRREASSTVRKGKPGIVDRVVLTEADGGNRLTKIKVRSTMTPELGDKFSSKHGQKGVVGAIVPEEDIPFTKDGMKPDLILNPHSIPSRMTMGHLLEMIAGKAASLQAEQIDGTPFDQPTLEEMFKMVKDAGFRDDGKESFYDGTTGEILEGKIFTGVVAYRRLF